ncbi:hypothetical protein FFT09_09820 [Saccharomonospora piscinae]|nr:hypothetical protein FFT09_09820 [Saccharomonospora piscinae]
MSESTDVRYHEPGASGWALTWGPLFALLGYGGELLAGGPTTPLLWLLTGAGLGALSALWVYARRRFLRVRLTPAELWQGTECLPLDRVAGLDETEAPFGTRVLGGGLSAPRRYAEVALRLDDDSVVVAWAKDGRALREALRAVLRDRA